MADVPVHLLVCLFLHIGVQNQCQYEGLQRCRGGVHSRSEDAARLLVELLVIQIRVLFSLFEQLFDVTVHTVR